MPWLLAVEVDARVDELTKLRDLQDPEVNPILIESMADPDLRVKLKAIDILGAREANAAVAPMSSMLFLRSTEQIAELHLVAELGRIGDAQGALPIMQFLAELEDERGRGTAVFALGEIGNEKATPLLKRAAKRSECDGTAAGARSAPQDRRRPSFRASETAGFAGRPACPGSDRSEARKASRARRGIAEPGALTLSRIS